LIFSEPSSAKNAATLAAFWLHQAAVYLEPNSFNWAAPIGIPSIGNRQASAVTLL
jgi:hypothetical protein